MNKHLENLTYYHHKLRESRQSEIYEALRQEFITKNLESLGKANLKLRNSRQNETK
jgi:hypothetical protein